MSSCSADDLLVFTDGTVDSLKGVMHIMEKFADMSGLHINAANLLCLHLEMELMVYVRKQEDMGLRLEVYLFTTLVYH